MVTFSLSLLTLIGAGLLNALLITGKNIRDIKVISCGAGAAGRHSKLVSLVLVSRIGFTIAKYFLSWGVRPENLIGVDVKGVIYRMRLFMNGVDLGRFSHQ